MNVVRINQSTGVRIQEPAMLGETYEARLGTEPLPRCMDMISAEEVIRRIEMYFEGGVVNPLADREARLCAERIPSLGWDSLLRAKVHGALLFGNTGPAVEPLLLGKAIDAEAPTSRNVAGASDTRAKAVSGADTHPLVTLCMLAEGDDFKATRDGVEAALAALPKAEFEFFVAARAVGQRTRAYLARLRAEEKIDFFADSRGDAVVLSLFCRLFERAETPFVCWFHQKTLLTDRIVNALRAGMERGKTSGIRGISVCAAANGAEQCWLACRDAIWGSDELPMPDAIPVGPSATNAPIPKTHGSGFPIIPKLV